ncbi:MAG: pantetheine-phosphate adenylyltransferase [Rhodospirillales bacterium]|jgi:pantetheine-phosphate adenylyltransferase|nr:pantetheine-phosphate adenylyltransferase [Rhodospirillales bacterium]
MNNARVGVYPGTFDPVTNGHMDIIDRATRIVDQLVIGVAVNAGKGPLFSLDERVEMLEEEVSRLRNGDGSRIRVRPFANLLMHFVEEVGATIILRGLRAVSDFEYEFQMAAMNTRLNGGVETVFLMASENHQFIASRFVKEVARLGGDIASFVPGSVKARTVRRLADPDARGRTWD